MPARYLAPAVGLVLAGGATPAPAAAPPAAPLAWQATMVLDEHPIELRFARPAAAAAPVLVLYATGDGGWKSLDRTVLSWIAEAGYPAAGFSSRSYLDHLGWESDTTTPRRVQDDFDQIVAFARERLSLPAGTPALLVGLSRGAGLSVVAAGHPSGRALAGVVALALTREEEHVVHHSRRSRHTHPGEPKEELVEIETYEYLSRLEPLAVAVIQSTRDRYLPAAEARELFGADGPRRRLVAIDARDHGFGGARAALRAEVEASVRWALATGRAEVAGGGAGGAPGVR